jgi:hypothetical protein
MANQNSSNTSTTDAAATAESAVKTGAENVTKAVQDSAQRTQQVREAVLDVAKQASLNSLDAYDRTVKVVLDYQKQFATKTGIAAIDDITAAQTKFVTDVNAAFTSAARKALA